MSIFLNPVLLSVGVLLVLCVSRVNVLLALIAAALSAGLAAKLPLVATMQTFMQGMSTNIEMALSYVLLGTFAAAMSRTGITKILMQKLTKWVGTRKGLLYLILLLVAIASQNLIPVHVAFIPILIPPLLPLFNELKIDRRLIACILSFGLIMPYVTIPAGFGLIFQRLLTSSLTQNGMELSDVKVWQSVWILGIGMTFGLLAAFWRYSKPRNYLDTKLEIAKKELTWSGTHTIIILAAVATFSVQVLTGSLPIGALGGLGIIFSLRDTRQQMDELVVEGCQMMGYVAFVILAASGFAAVLKQGQGIEQLVNYGLTILPHNQLAAAALVLALGLIITIGTGSSFGAVPILAAIFVPVFSQLGFSAHQAIIVLAAAGALGDAGSPASDSALGPTIGLNADRQHKHLRDTCFPTFICYNSALFVAALIGVAIF